MGVYVSCTKKACHRFLGTTAEGLNRKKVRGGKEGEVDDVLYSCPKADVVRESLLIYVF